MILTSASIRYLNRSHYVILVHISCFHLCICSISSPHPFPPTLQMPIECNDHKYLCCCWCRSGPLSMVVRIPRSGYVPGQKLLLNAELTNMTRSKVSYSKATLKQVGVMIHFIIIPFAFFHHLFFRIQVEGKDACIIVVHAFIISTIATDQTKPFRY